MPESTGYSAVTEAAAIAERKTATLRRALDQSGCEINPRRSKDDLATLERAIAMKSADALDRREVEKLAFGPLDGTESIYADWWADKPHQILARVLLGKLT
jgi:hypothetical protein